MSIFNFRKRPAAYGGEEKAETYDFSEIAAFFRCDTHKQALGVLSEQTCSDLGLDDLFMFTDRTASRVGQQYLYNLMRTIPEKDGEIKANEAIIEKLSADSEEHASVVKELQILQAVEAYSIAPLLQTEHPPVSAWWQFVLRVCSLLPTFFLLLFLFYKLVPALLLLFAALLVNGVLHYRNKHNGLGYLVSMPQLIKMLDAAGKLAVDPLLSAISRNVPGALASLETLRRSSKSLRIESRLDNDLAVILWSITEMIKIFFLIEPLAYNKMVRLLKDKNAAIETVFRFVGLTDSLSSVAFLRKRLPYYCLPGQPDVEVRMEADEMYHPLVEDCVSNTISIKGRSILFTGSNMSGKTTFIRTLGVNILAAQTLNTAFARQMQLQMPVMIHAALMLSDSLSDGKSFYMKEVESIRDMLSYSQSEHTNLFLLDEIFKGTNTTERIAAAKAVLSFLNTSRNIVVVSTHDTELGTFLANEYDLYHFCETISEGMLSFDYKLKSGNLYQRNAIRILEINDYPASLIEDAYSVIRQIEG